jgi:hypothetical protein
MFCSRLSISEPHRYRIHPAKYAADMKTRIELSALISAQLLDAYFDILVARCAAGYPADILGARSADLCSPGSQPYIHQIDTRLCAMSEPVGCPVNGPNVAVSKSDTLLLSRDGRRIGTIRFEMRAEVGFEVTSNSLNRGILVAATQFDVAGTEFEHARD